MSNPSNDIGKINDTNYLKQLESLYITDKTIAKNLDNIIELTNFLSKNKSKFNDIEKWVITDLKMMYDKSFKEDGVTFSIETYKAIIAIDNAKKALKKYVIEKEMLSREDIENLLIVNVKILCYILSTTLNASDIMDIEAFSNHIPMKINASKTENTSNETEKLKKYYFKDKIDTFNKKVDKMFYSEDIECVDSNGEPIDSSTFKYKEINNIRYSPKNESNKAFIAHQLIRSTFPTLDLGLYGVRNTFGFDLYSGLSGNNYIIDNDMKDVFKTTNLDKNILMYVIPNTLMAISKRTDNKYFRYGAASTPLLFQMIANFKERGNPLKMDDEKDINWTQILALGIPLVTEFISQLFPRKDIINAFGRKDVPFVNAANDVWQGSINNQNNNEKEAQHYYQTRRNIKQF